MRTPFFPIQHTTPETIEYLLDTVLRQTGSITFFTDNGRISVDMMVEPEDCGWDSQIAFIIKLWRNPEHLKHTRAKFVGKITTSTTEVKDFVLFYATNENRPERHKKAITVKKVETTARTW